MRYHKMAMTPLGVNYLHTCNPWVAVWWSVALPGLGHFYLGANLKGLLFMALEVLFNCLSNLNLAIYHTLLGEIALAKQVLVVKWALFYPAIYLLSFWDSYRMAVELNWLTRLERQEGQRQFRYQHLCVWGHAVLVKRSPWVAWFWSALVFGAGHVYNGQMLKAVILMGWQIALIGLSSLSDGIYLTLLGQPAAAAQVLNFQWLLFLPSIYLFNMWDAYHDCVEQNKLADEARWEWLRRQKEAKDGVQGRSSACCSHPPTWSGRCWRSGGGASRPRPSAGAGWKSITGPPSRAACGSGSPSAAPWATRSAGRTA